MGKCVDHHWALSATKVWHGKESVETQDCRQLCAGLVINKFHQEHSLLAWNAGPKQMLQQHTCRHRMLLFEPPYCKIRNHFFSFEKSVSQCFDNIFWFGIASHLDMKLWQAASLQEFASAVSYASSRVRDLLDLCGTLMTFLLWKHEAIRRYIHWYIHYIYIYISCNYIYIYCISAFQQLPWYGHNSWFGLISGSS